MSLCYRLDASSNNADLSVVSDKHDSAAMPSEPSSGGNLFAEELPEQFSLLQATEKKLDGSEVKFLFLKII